jgi:hypothetical protein
MHGSADVAAGGRLMRGIAGKLSHLTQCQGKVVCVRDMLQLLVGSQASSPSAGSIAQDSPTASALRGCLGSAVSLIKAIEQSTREAFQDWQVCVGRGVLVHTQA